MKTNIILKPVALGFVCAFGLQHNLEATETSECSYSLPLTT